MKKTTHYAKYWLYFPISKIFYSNIMKNYFSIYKKYLMLIRLHWTVFQLPNFSINAEIGTRGKHGVFPAVIKIDYDYEEKIKLDEAKKKVLGNIFLKKTYINCHNYCLIFCKYQQKQLYSISNVIFSILVYLAVVF